jgi:DNA-directed RNA polymerase sigma subunit (sigma70/sigma32)
MKKVIADIDEILHEWHTPKAERILLEIGVSERNWRLFALNGGYADGTKWSFRELADMEGNISHVRVWQIVKKTAKRLREYINTRKAK